jgi:phospholipid/cholesterol/gamma-HCH transport system substrate-binding protein
LSLLLNGGGVAQLKIIETELNNAVGGNQAQIKDLIKQLDTFVTGLDQQKSEIVRAIDNIDKLAAKLAAQQDDIAKAIEAMPGGLKVLADQRKQLVQMLQALSRLGAVGTQVISQSKADTAANLKALRPILEELTAAGDALPKSLQLLLTYPFSDGTTAAMRGDYTNMSADLKIDLSDPDALLGGLGLPTGGGTGGGGGGGGLPLPTPSIPSIPGVTPPPVKLPTGSTTSGGALCPPVCLAPDRSSGSSSDGSWRSLYGSES